MNLYFSHTQLLGELEKSGHVYRSIPRLVVVGLDLEGWKGECWAAGVVLDDGLVFTLLCGEGRNLLLPWKPCGHKLWGFLPPGCELVFVTDAWSPRSWPKRSRMSMRPLISRACSTSSSSVRTDTHRKLGFGRLSLCSNLSPRYLHVSPRGEQESGKSLGMGRREGAGLWMVVHIPPSRHNPSHKSSELGVAALCTSRKMRDSRPCQLPGTRMHLARQEQHSGKDRKVTAAAQHG